ncbi:MAG TPA: sugar ABC transporter substrate-binding protein [Spirochaetia bacterium]|nr:sugar ABC transporter substrate-binding protein [Spirochaetia bacterium]
MKRTWTSRLAILALAAVVVVSFAACGGGAKPKATFFWATYDGLTEDFRASLETAFNKASPDAQIQVVPISWTDMQNKVTTSLAGGTPPDISVVGTRWLLDYMGTNSIEDVSKYVSKETLDNINPAAMEAKIKGKLMGVPVAAGARIMAINNKLTKAVPKTMEELEADAKKVAKPGKVYGLIMPGKSYTELTDFAYYLYSAGGDFFAVNADGTYGKCTVNSDAGVKALTFMAQLALKDKVVQDGFTSQIRTDAHPVFYAGKAAYVFIGAWVESAMKQAKSDFPVTYALIPPFAGQKQSGLVITDSIAFFTKGKQLKAAGKFIDFFYKDEWKGKFDQLVGFPPVTLSAAKDPFWQTPLYKALIEASLSAKPWPLVDHFDTLNTLVWTACEKVFQGQASPKDALDEAAAAVDKSRGL